MNEIKEFVDAYNHDREIACNTLAFMLVDLMDRDFLDREQPATFTEQLVDLDGFNIILRQGEHEVVLSKPELRNHPFGDKLVKALEEEWFITPRGPKETLKEIVKNVCDSLEAEGLYTQIKTVVTGNGRTITVKRLENSEWLNHTVFRIDYWVRLAAAHLDEMVRDEMQDRKAVSLLSNNIS